MAEEETRERSTTTASLWPEAAVSDLNDSNRWVYFMKGTGSDRDMLLALGVLAQWLEEHMGHITTEEIEVVGQNGTATLTNLLLTLATAAGSASMNAEGLTFTDESVAGYSFSIGRAGVSLSKGKLTLTINSEGEVEITQRNSSNQVTARATLVKTGLYVTDGTTTNSLTKDGASKAALATEAAGYTNDGAIATELGKKMEPAANNNAGNTPNVFVAMASLPICIKWPSDSQVNNDVADIISSYVSTTYKQARATTGPSMYVIVNESSSSRQLSGFKQGSSTISVTVPADSTITVVRDGNDYYAPGYYAGS